MTLKEAQNLKFGDHIFVNRGKIPVIVVKTKQVLDSPKTIGVFVVSKNGGEYVSYFEHTALIKMTKWQIEEYFPE